MNNFNRVFEAVKELCGDQYVVNDPDFFSELARSLHLTPDRLDFYLDTLAAMGIIKYSTDKGFIKLTSYGKLKKKLFDS